MLAVQEELLKVANAKKDYTDLVERVEELRNEKEKILLSISEEKNVQSRLMELEEFLNNQELEYRKLWWRIGKKTHREDSNLWWEIKSNIQVWNWDSYWQVADP